MNPSALLSLDDALDKLLSFAKPLQRTESISTFQSDGRVLAHDLVSEIQVPAFNNSAMDGYALCIDDLRKHGGVLHIGQSIFAGQAPSALVSGQAARIFTGAPVPVGADAVVMQEDAVLLGEDKISFKQPPVLGQCIRRCGEDIQKNSILLAKGTRLNPIRLGLAASIGCASLSVSAAPKVALLSTGDELVMPGDIEPNLLPSGSIFNSNRFFLKTLLQRLGCQVTDMGNVPDDLVKTTSILSDAAIEHDLILSSGGVSVGEADFVKPAVQALGQLQLWSLSMKPGKPFAYGYVNSQINPLKQAHFIGLPGNPVSSLVTFLLLVRPFILSLQGDMHLSVRPNLLKANFVWSKADKRREFLRSKLNSDGGLDLFPNQSSGVLTSAVWGDGLIDNPPGTSIAVGDLVKFFSFTDLMS